MSINTVVTINNIFWWTHVMSYPIGSMGLVYLPINSSQKINYSCIEKTWTTPMGSYKHMSYISHVFPLVWWPRHRLLRAVKFLAGPEVSIVPGIFGVNFLGGEQTTGWWSESFGERLVNSSFGELNCITKLFFGLDKIPIDFTWTIFFVVPFFSRWFPAFFWIATI